MAIHALRRHVAMPVAAFALSVAAAQSAAQPFTLAAIPLHSQPDGAPAACRIVANAAPKDTLWRSDDRATLCRQIAARRSTGRCLVVDRETREACRRARVPLKELLVAADPRSLATRERAGGKGKELLLRLPLPREEDQTTTHQTFIYRPETGQDRVEVCKTEFKAPMTGLWKLTLDEILAAAGDPAALQPVFICSATIVGKDKLVTAAHCVDPRLYASFATSAGGPKLECEVPQGYTNGVTEEESAQGCDMNVPACALDVAVCTRTGANEPTFAARAAPPAINKPLQIAGFGKPLPGSYCSGPTTYKRKAAAFGSVPAGDLSLGYAELQGNEIYAGPGDSGGGVFDLNGANKPLVGIIVSSYSTLWLTWFIDTSQEPIRTFIADRVP